MPFKLHGQMPVRFLRTGKNQDAAGIAIQSVDGHHFLIAVLQKTEQMMRFPTKSVGDRQRASRFFHDQQVIVFV
jgi:hypothetical protein